MRNFLRKAVIGLAWLYAGSIGLWFILHLWFGDTVWWLALLNAFVPYFFLPIILIFPLCLIFKRRSLWISWSIPIFIFVWLYGHLFLPAWKAPSTQENPLSVMSFNIWGGSHAKETAQVIVENGSPDIVAIQELTPQMADILLEEVGHIYPYQAIQTDAQHRGMGILSRYPLEELAANQLVASDWQLQIVEIEINEKIITFYNCHPHSSNILVYFEQGSSIADNVEADFQRRRIIARQLVTDISERITPVIVAGDFNSTDRSDIYAILTSILANTHQKAGWGFGHTFPAYRGSFRGIPIIPKQMRLDMIFYTDEFVTLSSKVSKTYGESDHLPIVAELAMK